MHHPMVLDLCDFVMVNRTQANKKERNKETNKETNKEKNPL